MKLRYLFSIVLSAVLLLAGCVKEGPTGSYDNIKLSQSYLSIPETGGSVEVTLTATEAWNFVVTKSWPEVIETDKEGNETKRTPSWLSAASVMSGEAGEYKITFSAEASANGHEIDIEVKAGSNTQILRVRQGSLEASSATCAEIIAGPDGKTYRTKGTCTAIANTTYGNWYLNDGTGEIYIYGTLDAKGAEKNFTSLGLEVGDVVEVEGPKTTYGSTIELVNVTVIKITKSLAKVLTETQTYPIEGGEFDVKVAYKGSNFNPSVPEEYRDWASVVDVKTIAGVPSKIETNPADTAVVTVKLFPNAGGDRKGQINFASGSSKVFYEFTQEGAIIETTASEINAAEDGDTQYRITGYVSQIANTKYGNLYIKDHTGEVYVYGTNDFADSGIEEGDIITVVGPKTSYNGAPQMKNVTVENRIEVKDIDVASFKALADDAETWYRLTGKVIKSSEANTKFDLETYGNFAIEDETGNVYVYGVVSGWGGPKKEFGKLGVKEGDTITIVAHKASYNGLNQAGSAFYVSHESGSDQPGEPETPSESVITFSPEQMPEAYPKEATEYTIGTTVCELLNVAYFAQYSTGIQMKKGGSYILTKSSVGKIKSIKLYNLEGKTWDKDRLTLYVGTDANPSTAVEISSADENSSVYEIKGDYTHFKLLNASENAVNMEKIEITVE
ncbi:MAG: DNA-binding protein [Bacteroidales bacterium]|nr:DNA-binding protein [Bacteroidales bacterium]